MTPSKSDDGRPDGGETIDSIEGTIQGDPLIVLFGDHAKARMVMALLDAHPRPLNPSDIVENAGLGSRQTWYDYRDDLEATGLVRETGTAGNSPLYGLDEEDDRVEWLEKLRNFTGSGLEEARREGWTAMGEELQ